MNNPTLHFAHIGLHKTATTWLQTAVFSQHEQLVMAGVAVHTPLHAHLHHLYAAEPETWDCAAWSARFWEMAPPHEAAYLGVSAEILSGNMFTGRRAVLVAERLTQAFADFRVVIVLRHPLSYVGSLYSQYVKQGGALSLRGLLNDPNIPGKLIYQKLNYQELVSAYQSRIGAERVLVLPFEWLKEDAEAFLHTLAEFIEIAAWPDHVYSSGSRNPSFTLVGRELMRLCNYLGFRRQRTRTLIQRLERRLFSRVFPNPTIPDIAFLQQFAGFADVLRSENYQFWDGDLARFNYTF